MNYPLKLSGFQPSPLLAPSSSNPCSQSNGDATWVADSSPARLSTGSPVSSNKRRDWNAFPQRPSKPLPLTLCHRGVKLPPLNSAFFLSFLSPVHPPPPLPPCVSFSLFVSVSLAVYIYILQATAINMSNGPPVDFVCMWKMKKVIKLITHSASTALFCYTVLPQSQLQSNFSSFFPFFFRGHFFSHWSHVAEETSHKQLLTAL